MFSQRLSVKLNRYCGTIRESKLPLSQVYFAASLLSLVASRLQSTQGFIC